jgi:hypothetical protein
MAGGSQGIGGGRPPRARDIERLDALPPATEAGVSDHVSSLEEIVGPC